jgi:hypothetical protein
MARGEPEFRVRLPPDLLQWLREKAAGERRSMTQEVTIRLMQARAADQSGRATGVPAAGEALRA